MKMASRSKLHGIYRLPLSPSLSRVNGRECVVKPRFFLCDHAGSLNIRKAKRKKENKLQHEQDQQQQDKGTGNTKT